MAIKQVNYKLNKEKAVIKKLQASNRDSDYTIQMCDGTQKNLMLHFQAGLYEFVRKAAHFHFISAASYCYETEISALQENSSGHIVQTTYKIRKKGKGQIAYTMNFYHTKSAILVNGKMYADFLDKDWPCICQVINDAQQLSSDMSHTKLNIKMRESLQYLSQELMARNWESIDSNDPQQDNECAISTVVLDNEDHNHKTDDASVATETEPHDLTDRRPLPGTITNVSLQTQERPQQGFSDDIEHINNRSVLSPAAQPVMMAPHSRIHTANMNPVSPFRGLPAITAPPDHRSPTPLDDDSHLPSSQQTRSTDDSHNKQIICDLCIQTQREWREALMTIQAREKKLLASERNLKQREKELEKTLHQLETQKALITGLENRIREMAATNKLLQQVIDASGVQDHHRHPRIPQQAGTYGDPFTSPSGHSQAQSMQDEIRSLRDELRWKDIESKFSTQLHMMENRLMSHLQCRSAPPADMNLPHFFPFHPAPLHHLQIPPQQQRPHWTQPHPGFYPTHSNLHAQHSGHPEMSRHRQPGNPLPHMMPSSHNNQQHHRQAQAYYTASPAKNVVVSESTGQTHSAPKPQDSSPHSVATGSHGNMTQAVRAQDNRVPSAISPVAAGPSGLQTENDKESVGRWRNALRDLERQQMDPGGS